MSRSINKSGICSIFATKKQRIIELRKKSGKFFESGSCELKCSRIEELIGGEQTVFCKKCIHCLLHNQTRKTKLVNVTWAPKKATAFKSIRNRNGKSIIIQLFVFLILLYLYFYSF